jgi:hypothetical protein
VDYTWTKMAEERRTKMLIKMAEERRTNMWIKMTEKRRIARGSRWRRRGGLTCGSR